MPLVLVCLTCTANAHSQAVAPAPSRDMTQAWQSQSTLERGRILSQVLEGRLVQRQKTPGGLGAGNIGGVDESSAFSTTLARGMAVDEVLATLEAAGFATFMVTNSKGQKAFNATKDMQSLPGTKTTTVAIIRISRDGDGQERMTDVDAIMTWSAL